MSEEKRLALPGNGYDIIAKILHAYVLSGGGEKPLSLDAVASRAGMDSTQVSRNQGFLISLGLLTSGKSKSLTQTGKELALALSNKIDEDIARAWKQIILSSQSARSILDMISIQGAIDKSALPAKIASTLGQPYAGTAKSGINALIEIFEKAGLLEETDGNYSLALNAFKEESVKRTIEDIDRTEGREDNSNANVGLDLETRVSDSRLGARERARELKSTPPSVNVEIHLHIAEGTNAEQIDATFASIAKHLYGKSSANDS